MTVDSSSLSKAGSNDGARDKERARMSGVREEVVQPDGCLEEGRWDMGRDKEMR
jgi:hypothetical protein